MTTKAQYIKQLEIIIDKYIAITNPAYKPLNMELSRLLKLRESLIAYEVKK